MVNYRDNHVKRMHDYTVCFQRLSALCKLLGRGEETLKRTFQSLSSSESLDLRSVLFSDSAAGGGSAGGGASPGAARQQSGSSQQQPSPANASFSNNVDHEQSLLMMRKESDSESGFEDGSSSQMSRSLADDPGPLGESESIDCLQVRL